MQTQTLSTITDAQFQTIYTDKKMRNAVASAHGCADQYGKLLYKKAMMYPDNYIVADEQIKAAKDEREADKKRLIAEYSGKLVLVGMGSEYEARYEDDVCNYRVRGEFYNNGGRKFFIEFGHGRPGTTDTRVDHSSDRDLEDRFKHEGRNDQPYNNYKKLERLQNYPKYTLSNLLHFVNSNFDCSFREIVIDQYTLSPDDMISKVLPTVAAV